MLYVPIGKAVVFAGIGEAQVGNGAPRVDDREGHWQDAPIQERIVFVED